MTFPVVADADTSWAGLGWAGLGWARGHGIGESGLSELNNVSYTPTCAGPYLLNSSGLFREWPNSVHCIGYCAVIAQDGSVYWLEKVWPAAIANFLNKPGAV
jgi:hypothetical protein